MAEKKTIDELIAYLDHGAVTGEYSREIDNAVKAVKASEERRMEYMMQFVRDNEMRAEGRAEGEKKLAELITKLMNDKRYDLIQRAADDKNVREELYLQYNLIP